MIVVGMKEMWQVLLSVDLHHQSRRIWDYSCVRVVILTTEIVSTD